MWFSYTLGVSPLCLRPIASNINTQYAGVVQWLESQPSKLIMRVRFPSPAPIASFSGLEKSLTKVGGAHLVDVFWAIFFVNLLTYIGKPELLHQRD